MDEVKKKELTKKDELLNKLNNCEKDTILILTSPEKDLVVKIAPLCVNLYLVITISYYPNTKNKKSSHTLLYQTEENLLPIWFNYTPSFITQWNKV